MRKKVTQLLRLSNCAPSPLSSTAHILFKKKSFGAFFDTIHWLDLRLTSAFGLTANLFSFIILSVSLVGPLQGIRFRTITS